MFLPSINKKINFQKKRFESLRPRAIYSVVFLIQEFRSLLTTIVSQRLLLSFQNNVEGRYESFNTLLNITRLFSYYIVGYVRIIDLS